MLVVIDSLWCIQQCIGTDNSGDGDGINYDRIGCHAAVDGSAAADDADHDDAGIDGEDNDDDDDDAEDAREYGDDDDDDADDDTYEGMALVTLFIAGV